MIKSDFSIRVNRAVLELLDGWIGNSARTYAETERRILTDSWLAFCVPSL